MEIEQLLKYCVNNNASDLHILPGVPPLMRVYGELCPIQDYVPLTPEASKELVYSLLTREQQERFEQELVFETAVYFSRMGNFRISVLHQLRGVAAVVRIVPDKIQTMDDLGLPQLFQRIMMLPHGLVLVTGPTGSGKSTTQAAMIDFINTIRSCHIITIEDPVEFIHTSKKSAINQIQVGRDTPDFATAMRATLRQDPDVILLGELRDLETIRLALVAAETGHLVIATLHSSTAPLAISRIVDIFPTAEKPRVRNLLSETIQAVICQTLVKKISGGRVAAFEIMLATPAIRHMIRQDMIAQMETTLQTNGDIGMCTMSQYLAGLAAKRIITNVVARSVATGRESFKSAVEGKKKR